MSLVPRFLLGDLDLTEYPYGIEFGSQYGAPENVTEVLNSLMADGELLSSTRTSNREMTITVLVEGPDLGAVAQAEAALVMEANRERNTLTIDPGDGYAVATVFDTFRAAITFDRSDAAEMATLRRYVLTIPALPYGRSETLVIEAAEAIPSIGETVNAADSTTGWSAPTAVIPSGSGYVDASPQPSSMLAVDITTKVEGTGSIAAKSWRVTAARYSGFLPSGDGRQVDAKVTLTQAISVPAGGYLSFAVKFDSTWGRMVTNSYWGITYQQYGTLDTFTITSSTGSRTYKNEKSSSSDLLLSDAIIEALGDGWTRYTFRIDEALSIMSMEWTSQHLVPWTDDPADADRPRILVDWVALAEATTLGKQVLKTIDVAGTARTTGALHVAAPSDSVALGKVLAYTVSRGKVAAGWRPDLSQWVLPGATTGTVAGRSDVFNGITLTYGAAGSPVFEAPASMFRSGAYTLAASVRFGTDNGSLSVRASLVMGGTVVAAQSVRTVTEVATGAWEIRALGTVYLPPAFLQFPSADATVRFEVLGTQPPALEELYAFPVEGDLTIIDCGSGMVGPSASSHLWIDSPSPDQPQGGYWRGSTPDRIDAIGVRSVAALTVPGTHSFEPGEVLAFVASLDAQGPSVSFDYYPRHFFHATG